MNQVFILAIESSCDDTSASVLCNNVVLSNVIANQAVHQEFGGVVPELASRAHQQHIIPVVDKALKDANITKNKLNAIAFTRGPGLLGSLLVGVSFAKAFAKSLNLKLIEVDHLESHIYSLFIDKPNSKVAKPEFPFIALLVSGGHTKLAIVKNFNDIEFVGDTIDDAAGEAFDKTAKILGLGYPGGPIIDKLSKQGNSQKFKFNKPKVEKYMFSFSGLKTSILYFIRDELKLNKDFIENNLNDICASVQKTIVDILLEKVSSLANDSGIKHIGVVGGVSANSFLKESFNIWGQKNNINIYFPEIDLTTDNAAMIGMSAYLKFKENKFADINCLPYSS